MEPRKRVKTALSFKSPDRIPRDLWILPYISLYEKEEYEEILKKYPMDISSSQPTPGSDEKTTRNTAKIGSYEDDWGSTWHVAEPGVIGEVVKPFLGDWSYLDRLIPPYDLIEKRDKGYINHNYENTDKFVISDVTARPFERLQFLRGTQNLFMDIASDDGRFHKLLKIVHEYYLEDISFWCQADVDAIFIMDDWGTNTSLLIDPQTWRRLFKPLYQEYCDMIHSCGKYVFMHSDGNTESIFGDLVEIGIDAINSQLFTMDIKRLGRDFSKKITFWGEMDRQKTLPFGSPEDVKSDVERIRSALKPGEGGFIAQCEWGKKNPRENIEAVYSAWEEV